MSTSPAPGVGSALRLVVPNVPRILVYIVGLLPAVWLFYLALTGRIGADPVAQLEWGLGLWALRFLIATLCITPLRQLFKVNLLRYRRAFGLIAFYYVLLHLSVWVVLDRGVDVSAALLDILRRPYITIGMAAFVLLVPLAVTSNNFSIRTLGGKAWNRLHKLSYAAVALGALHFIMIKKVWLVEPVVYALVVPVLLGFRVVWPRIGSKAPKRRRAATGRQFW